ncbi:tRNA adenosine(34) deaminase TadA [bacterium]|nr:tRNA adenosine(34) deaminase TadA [bacterium]
MNHEYFMQEAIEEAKKAAAIKEVPIGAVAVVDGEIVARAHNLRETTQDPFGHAESLLIKELAQKYNFWRLENVTIYVTCEPCIMCMGAMLQSRIQKIVYGCRDPKAGACGSLYDLSNDTRLNHQIEVVSGVLEKECGLLLSNFFKTLRK